MWMTFFTPLHQKGKHLLKVAIKMLDHVRGYCLEPNVHRCFIKELFQKTHGKATAMESIFSKAETLGMQLYQKNFLPKCFANEFCRNFKIDFTYNT